jgi:hypothetical protein
MTTTLDLKRPEFWKLDDVDAERRRLIGIDRGQCVWLQIGREFAVPGEFEAGHSDEEKGKLSAVHFVRFRLSAEAARAFAGSEVHLVVDHPAERARTRLEPETRAALAQDLSG